VESYRRALTVNGNDVPSLDNLAWLLSEVQKKPDEAQPLELKALVVKGPPQAIRR